jgi:hypothetical protein
VKVIKNYTLTLNFVKKKNHTHLKKHIDVQSQAIYDDQNNSKKILHFLEDFANGVQVGHIEQITV